MKREDVLELKIIDTLITEDGIDYIICKLSQNTDILTRGVNTEYSKSFEYPGWDIRKKQLYTLGAIKEYDNLPFAVPTSDIELLKEKVRVINEKYGIKKRWRAKEGEYFYYINFLFETDRTVEAFTKKDDVSYNLGNYFKTEQEAQEYAEYMKKCSLEWHEKTEDSNERNKI